MRRWQGCTRERERNGPVHIVQIPTKVEETDHSFCLSFVFSWRSRLSDGTHMQPCDVLGWPCQRKQEQRFEGISDRWPEEVSRVDPVPTLTKPLVRCVSFRGGIEGFGCQREPRRGAWGLQQPDYMLPRKSRAAFVISLITLKVTPTPHTGNSNPVIRDWDHSHTWSAIPTILRKFTQMISSI